MKKSYTFFEADLPFIMRKKQIAIKNSNIYIPDNLQFVTIDLAEKIDWDLFPALMGLKDNQNTKKVINNIMTNLNITNF